MLPEVAGATRRAGVPNSPLRAAQPRQLPGLPGASRHGRTHTRRRADGSARRLAGRCATVPTIWCTKARTGCTRDNANGQTGCETAKLNVGQLGRADFGNRRGSCAGTGSSSHSPALALGRRVGCVSCIRSQTVFCVKQGYTEHYCPIAINAPINVRICKRAVSLIGARKRGSATHQPRSDFDQVFRYNKDESACFSGDRDGQLVCKGAGRASASSPL